MPQTLTVTAPTGLALTLRVFPDGLTTQAVGSPFTLTEDTQRKGYYSATVGTPLGGIHHAVIYRGSSPIGNVWIQFDAINGENVARLDRPVATSILTAEQVWTYSSRTITGFGTGTSVTFPAAEFTTSPVSYCDVSALFDHIDETIVADAVLDNRNATRPTAAEMSNAATVAGRRVQKALLAASGEVETAALAKRLYTPADLLSLTGAIRIKLEATVAGIAVLYLYGRRAPATGKHEELPLVRHSQETLDKLRTGERVFGFIANLEAGAGMSAVSITPDTYRGDIDTVSEASRFFGQRDR
jgi:hypothetical protein